MSFWKEVSRRNVIKVGIAYAVAAWLIIHPVDIIFPILHLPEWSITLVTAFLIICFPFILIFSWVYEVTPKGLKRTKEVPLSKSITHLTGKRLNYIITGLLVVAVAYLLFDKYFIGHGAVETKQAAVVADVDKTKKTIAVLPFENLSSDPEQVYFVDGLSEEILNSLAQIQDLNVIGRTSSFSFKGSNKTVQEIAGVLGADHVLEGSVRKAGKALRITAQLLRATDGVHLWSKTYDRELKDIFAVQEDIAMAVANELKATLGIGKSFRQLGGTENEKAYELYLAAKGVDLSEDAERALEIIDKALAIDPRFASAWVLKANAHGYLSTDTPAKRAVTERDASLKAALKAIEIESNLADGYAALGFIKMSKGDFIEAEKAFRQALELTPVGYLGSYMFVGVFYNAVGHFKRANKIFDEIRQNDPLNKPARAMYILNLAFLGDSQQAEEEYERGMTLFNGQWGIGDFFIMDIRLGSGDVVSLNEIVSSGPIYDTVKEHLDTPTKGLTELRRLFANGGDLSSGEFFQISMAAAYFGDTELAMEAVEKGFEIESSGLFFTWTPVMHKVRQTPRFKKFIRENGLVDYWNKFGWPDICHKLDNGDFECD
jgi:adenylate cyclase